MSEFNVIPELDAKGLRKFAFTFSIIICLLFGFAVPFIFQHSLPIWPWVIGVVFIIWGALAPSTLRLIYYVWMRFGLIMSKLTTPLILGVLFYLILTPVGLVMRLFKADPMAREIDKKVDTYRKLREDSMKTNFEKPF